MELFYRGGVVRIESTGNNEPFAICNLSGKLLLGFYTGFVHLVLFMIPVQWLKRASGMGPRLLKTEF